MLADIPKSHLYPLVFSASPMPALSPFRWALVDILHLGAPSTPQGSACPRKILLRDQEVIWVSCLGSLFTGTSNRTGFVVYSRRLSSPGPRTPERTPTNIMQTLLPDGAPPIFLRWRESEHQFKRRPIQPELLSSIPLS